jgi:hypothetical protein
MSTQESPLVCNYSAIPAENRDEHLTNAAQIFQAVQKVKELPTGYNFQLPNQSHFFMDVANFINHERLCCPFYHFKLEIEPNNGALWFGLEGNGVKELLKTVLGGSLKPEVFEAFFETAGDTALKTRLVETSLEFPQVLKEEVV